AFPLVAAIAELVEDPAHHQTHRLGRRRRALQGRRVIDTADLDDPGRGVDAHQARDPDGASAAPFDDAMTERVVSGTLTLQPAAKIGKPRKRAIWQIGPVSPF